MKATLTFTLPEEREEYENAYHGVRYRIALEDLAREFRNKVKYAGDQNTTWDAARELFWDTLKVNGVELP